MDEPASRLLSRRRATFGALSILCSCAAFCGWVYLMLHFGDILYQIGLSAGLRATWGGSEQKHIDLNDPYTVAGGVVVLFSVVGLVFAVIGLVRGEQPRWPAVVGLIVPVGTIALIVASSFGS